MTVQVTVNTDRLNRILHNLGANTATAVRKIAFRVEAEAKVRAPHDTGALINSIYTSMGGASTQPPMQPAGVEVVPLPTPQEPTTAHVGPSVNYGIYQEFGTHKMAAHPYLAPAIATVASELERNPDIFTEVVTDDSR